MTGRVERTAGPAAIIRVFASGMVAARLAMSATASASGPWAARVGGGAAAKRRTATRNDAGIGMPRTPPSGK
ncbi:MAG: hypothetical protein BWY91_01217 [bacterium ADurb.BinA028]|nr:MAG: hypothetical protein BWY91_01217 [bacterium ADurb.BinA028]